jgi:predicted N-formylglutamate amidohydrolase
VDPLTLLNPQDPIPVRETAARDGGCPFVLIGDHAGSAIPAALGNLGLSDIDRARHIAVDIGVEALGRALAPRLGAPFVSQAYSRLVVDCNRDPGHAGWIAEASDGSVVPGNLGLSSAQREARRTEIFEPYHRAIAAALDRREGRKTVLVSLHSFTPVMNGFARPWEIGVLQHGHEDGFALRVLQALRARRELNVGDNEPYRMDANDYTVPRHAFARGLPYVELEVRQDLLGDAAGVEGFAKLLAKVLPAAL